MPGTRRIRLAVPDEPEPAFEAVRHLDGDYLDIPAGQMEWKATEAGHYVVFAFVGGQREHRRNPEAPDEFVSVDVFRPKTWGITGAE
ncbi:hypothetical protein AB0I72_00570 [Nocardiopsis sp. NPDC049922]|uniref:hypothetical protein n=1 Tax=Nocardiopsis sp. NPDC049922 TaxID=3155157 RepID=UPI003407D670